MAVTREEKAVQLADLKDKFTRASSVIFAHYIGLTVSQVSDLRRKLRASEAEMKVAKKTLMAIAAKEANIPETPESDLDGPVACIFSFSDPVAGAQIAFKFSKDHPQVEFLGGIFDGKPLTKAQASELAKIPSRLVLLATFAGMVRSPLVKFASICNSPLTGFARLLSEMAKKGGVSPEASAPTEAAVASEPEPAAPSTPSEPPAPETTDTSVSTESTPSS